MFLFLLSIPGIVIIAIFLYIMAVERRTLYTGVFFILSGISLGGFIVMLVFRYSQWLADKPLLISAILMLTVFLIFLIVIFPVVLMLFFFYNGILLMKKEGFRLRNLLSLGFSLALFLYLVVWPCVGSLSDHTLWSYLYGYTGMLALWFMFMISMYTLANILNLLHFKAKRFDYVVVLGAGLQGNKVTPLLAGRIDKGIELYRKNPGCKLIMSGGQGNDEQVAEAVAMADYALGKGIPPESILLETHSTNTRENILFSRQLMEKENPRFAIATNSYHVFRALAIAKNEGLKCIGYGAKTKWYFTLNAFIREFIAYMKYTRRRQQRFLLILSALYLLFFFLQLLVTGSL